MPSKTIYTQDFISNQYCVYHTIYSGHLLPQNYIGSSSVYKIQNKNYHGTIKSKKYKSIWLSELKENLHLFNTTIISYHDTRPEALYKELQLQRIFNIVQNPLFINMAYANKNGCFGRDVSGENNPRFNIPYKTSNETKEKQKQNHIKTPRIWVMKDKICKFIPKDELYFYIDLGWETGRSYIRTKPNKPSTIVFCILCKKPIQVNNINNHFAATHLNEIPHAAKEFEYFGSIFIGYKQLSESTGCTRYLYNRYYLKGIDPSKYINRIDHIYEF